VMAATVPNCRAYDPAFAYEVATIFDHGARRMVSAGADEFYYLTVMNESYAQPSMPAGVAGDIIKGMYRFARFGPPRKRAAIRLLGSGAILREVIAAGDLLAHDWNVSGEVWSVTSFSELAREARAVERYNRFNPGKAARRSHLETCLGGSLPIVAATDYVRAYPGLIAPFLEARFTVLGTDGFGRSDNRVELRRFFEVDRFHVAVAALASLARAGKVPRATVGAALKRYKIQPAVAGPWEA
jgi:pyruvate dehydrogenase E1 component